MATQRPAPIQTPLAGVLTITFLGSLGTGGVTNGVFFLTESAFAWDRTLNYALALFMGLIYIAAALAAGPITRAAGRRNRPISSRSILMLALAAIGVSCFLPSAVAWITGTPRAWTIWVTVGVFSPATGLLWPGVEAYLCGGRRGRSLRHAIGSFNIVWASALVIVFWAMGPLVATKPLWVLAGLGVAHLASIAALLAFPPEPGRHLQELDTPHEIDPVRARKLLVLFRTLMPVSYLVLATLNPFFPRAAEDLEIAVDWRTPVVSTWMIARVGVFALLGGWHGWHGSRAMPAIGWGILIAGFGATVLAPPLGPGAGVWVFVAGLAAVGAGMSIIYVGSLYYGMEAHDAHVDAGGAHEALVGAGYTIGPACGLGAVWATSGSPESFEPALLGTIVVICVVMSLGGVVLSRRAGPRG
ncbi:MAG: hypothetical protein RIB60_05140 [Phycisphaerales bacterium]